MSKKIKLFALLSSASMFVVTIAFGEVKLVAKVGDYDITQDMVDTREKVAKIYYPHEKSQVGLIQLIASYTNAQILKNNKQTITEELLKQEEVRIDSQTKDPKTLGLIKDIFVNNHELYLKAFILPTYVDRIIYFDFFQNDYQIQNEAKEKAQLLYINVNSNPSSLLIQGKKYGYKTFLIAVSKKNGFVWTEWTGKTQKQNKKKEGETNKIIDQSYKSPKEAELQKGVLDNMQSQKDQYIARWINEIALTTPIGTLFKSIVKEEQTWLVLRYMGKNVTKKSEEEYKFEVVSIAKPEFGEWLKKEQAKIKIIKF